MFSRPIKPLSSRSYTEDIPKHISDRATILNYPAHLGGPYFAIVAPSARSPYNIITEIIDDPHDATLLNELIVLRARAFGANDPIEIHTDDKQNRIVTITQSGKPSKKIIWHPINILVHDYDIDSERITQTQSAYAVISCDTSVYRSILGMSPVSKLPDFVYLLSDTAHARANFDRLYRTHIEGPRHASPPTAMLSKRLHRLSLPKIPLSSSQAPRPTTALYAKCFAQGLRFEDKKPTTPTLLWKR